VTQANEPALLLQLPQPNKNRKSRRKVAKMVQVKVALISNRLTNFISQFNGWICAVFCGPVRHLLSTHARLLPMVPL
jgi:hypothetical protein